MPIYGDLRTLPLPDLLRLAGSTQKTGVLEVERNGISRRIEFRKGHVGSCSSNDPASRLGQYLLFRGRLNPLQLQHLLTLQEATGKRLGLLMVEMGLLTRKELATEVACRARETIYGLFDWDNAYFRFDDGATLDPDQIEVNLSIDQLIDGGEQRMARLSEIRRTFRSSGVLLVRQDKDVPADLIEGPLTRRIFDAIDGRRTIAEIVLHARAAEFVTLEFLYRLHERELVSVREERLVPEEGATLLDMQRKPLDEAKLVSFEAAVEWHPAGSSSVQPPTPGANPGDDLVQEIEKATRLMEQHDYEAAMELLRACCREHATDYVRRLLFKAESALVAAVWKDASYGARVPVLRMDKQELLSQAPVPDESFLLSLIDGMTDLQAIVWLTPMREVDVIVAVQRMIRKGMIELADPVAA